VKVVLDGRKLVARADTEELVQGTWTGHVELRSSQEDRTYLEVANSSAAGAIFDTGNLSRGAECGIRARRAAARLRAEVLLPPR
jgi:hypothetical protein